MNEHIQGGKRKIRPVVSKVASVANLTHGRAIAGKLGVESVLQVQRGGEEVEVVLPANSFTKPFYQPVCAKTVDVFVGSDIDLKNLQFESLLTAITGRRE